MKLKEENWKALNSSQKQTMNINQSTQERDLMRNLATRKSFNFLHLASVC